MTLWEDKMKYFNATKRRFVDDRIWDFEGIFVDKNKSQLKNFIFKI